MAPSERSPLRPEAAVGNAPQRRRRVATVALVIVLAVTSLLVYASISPPSSPPAATTTTGADEFLCDRTRQDSGYVKLPHKKDDHYFYWYFESRRSPTTDPLVLWLAGGPGCSSLATLLAENGPCTVLPDLSTKFNNYSWTNEANVIWLDQPTNVGFSYGLNEDLDHNEDDVQQGIFWFLQGFMDKHPELAGRPLFLAGESYAGHYIPAAAHYIWQQNEAAKNTTTNASARLNLQGIAIGNGLVNPVVQSRHALDMVNNSYNVKLLNASELAAAQAAVPRCTRLTEDCQDKALACLEALEFCQRTILAPIAAASQRNPFDIRLTCNESDAMHCYDMRAVTAFLNSARVRAQLHVRKQPPKVWEECSPAVGGGFVFDVMRGVEDRIAALLNGGGARVLVYAGDADLVCNWQGSRAWMLELEWRGQQQFIDAPEREFVVGSSRTAGVARALGTQLAFVRLFDAGHFAARDQPAVALELMQRFLRNEPI